MHITTGKYKKRRLLCPKGDEVRPTSSFVRERCFNICQQEIEGAEVLDLFSGTGAMGIEALSRGAQSATFIERNPYVVKYLKKNLLFLDPEDRYQVLNKDVFRAAPQLAKWGKTFDFIYADPPYAKDRKDILGASILQLVIKNGLLKPGGSFFLEESEHAEVVSLDLPEEYQLSSKRTLGRTVLYHFKRTPSLAI